MKMIKKSNNAIFFAVPLITLAILTAIIAQIIYFLWTIARCSKIAVGIYHFDHHDMRGMGVCFMLHNSYSI